MSDKLAIVMLGNIFDGYRCVGPFSGFDEAQDWGDRQKEEYLLASLDPPYPDTPVLDALGEIISTEVAKVDAGLYATDIMLSTPKYIREAMDAHDLDSDAWNDLEPDEQTRMLAEVDANVMIDPAPACWASYLVNGDASGLDAVEKTACDLHRELNWAGWHVVSVIGEPYFSWSYGTHGGTAQGGDLIEYVLHYGKKEG